MLSRYEVVLFAGAPEPVTFFGYPGVRSRILTDEQEKITLCTDRQNVVEALEYLADALGAPAHLTIDDNLLARPKRPALPSASSRLKRPVSPLRHFSRKMPSLSMKPLQQDILIFPFRPGYLRIAFSPYPAGRSDKASPVPPVLQSHVRIGR